MINQTSIEPTIVEVHEEALSALLNDVAKMVQDARKKHCYLGKSLEHATRAVLSEQREFEAQAMLMQEPDGSVDPVRQKKARAEAMDCIVTQCRWILGEYVDM